MELISYSQLFILLYITITQHTLEEQTLPACTHHLHLCLHTIQLQKVKKFISTISDIQMTSESIQS